MKTHHKKQVKVQPRKFAEQLDATNKDPVQQKSSHQSSRDWFFEGADNDPTEANYEKQYKEGEASNE